MDWNLIPDNILIDWINYELSIVQSNEFKTLIIDFITLIRLSDTNKILRLKTYLQNRIAADNLQINNAETLKQQSVDSLNEDINICNTAITNLNNAGG